MKISISVLHFSTELAEKSRIYDLLSRIVIYFLKNDNKHLSEMKPKKMTNRCGTNFDDRSKVSSNFSRNGFAYKLSNNK